ncbi:hypothetical protein KP79_PYT04228 [Mizuhopecten yessoensis]|uniref:Cyclic GMP-AMP synthase n=1 Tax=Mizuhopecten yessoensis TaxID=6573 RepID=A0A210Q4T1_MIZYE|nr:hypothetical protein KP79_PYT04228 [Mizuhopecten yessoensis]
MADTDDVSKHERSLLFVTEQATHGTEDTPCRTEPCLPSPILFQPQCPSRTWTSKPLYTQRDKNGATPCTDNIGPSQDDIKVMEEVSPGLNTFIQDVMLQSRCKESVERTTIISDVGQTMDAVLNEMQTKHEMFKGSSILKVGSIYEDTKIDEPNEFDFLIELPALITVTEIKAFPIVGQVRERGKGKRYLSLLCRDIFRRTPIFRRYEFIKISMGMCERRNRTYLQ